MSRSSQSSVPGVTKSFLTREMSSAPPKLVQTLLNPIQRVPQQTPLPPGALPPRKIMPQGMSLSGARRPRESSDQDPPTAASDESATSIHPAILSSMRRAEAERLDAIRNPRPMVRVSGPNAKTLTADEIMKNGLTGTYYDQDGHPVRRAPLSSTLSPLPQAEATAQRALQVAGGGATASSTSQSGNSTVPSEFTTTKAIQDCDRDLRTYRQMNQKLSSDQSDFMTAKELEEKQRRVKEAKSIYEELDEADKALVTGDARPAYLKQNTVSSGWTKGKCRFLQIKQTDGQFKGGCGSCLDCGRNSEEITECCGKQPFRLAGSTVEGETKSLNTAHRFEKIPAGTGGNKYSRVSHNHMCQNPGCKVSYWDICQWPGKEFKTCADYVDAIEQSRVNARERRKMLEREEEEERNEIQDAFLEEEGDQDIPEAIQQFASQPSTMMSNFEDHQFDGEGNQ